MHSRSSRSACFGVFAGALAAGIVASLADAARAFAATTTPTTTTTPESEPGGPPPSADGPWSAPVDVTVKEPTEERRSVAVEWNPVALFINRLSANVEIVPVDHHALVLTGFYFNSRTAAFVANSQGLVPSQRFEGGGGEVGYRYYTGRGGPRGFFVGPSFLFADVQATPSPLTAMRPQTSIQDYGVALDVGWQALVASRWIVSLGAGGEYVFTSTSLPDQQAPASYYADSGLHPRALAAIGCAF